MLVASMNPCQCGNYGSADKECTCNPYQVKKYRSKISGPLMDRIDIQVEVPSLKIDEITNINTESEKSEDIKKRVIAARQIQYERFKNLKIYCNCQMGPKEIKNLLGFEPITPPSLARIDHLAESYERIDTDFAAFKDYLMRF